MITAVFSIELSDEFAARLQPVWNNLPRKVLEVVVVEAYREQADFDQDLQVMQDLASQGKVQLP
ncbi:MAG: hypothetical protein HC824_18090 [Synechococcales cyanobacterium RM1_1_8]|nr:hypothetical protein [Synechococcales cyanobacterium RM1_1_8]